MVRDLVDRHPKLKRGDTKAENPSVKQQSNGNSNIYHKILEYEEGEALACVNDEDLKLFKDVCAKFKEIIKNVADIKLKNNYSNENQISEQRIDGSVLFVKLKKLNRLEKFRLNHAREKLYDTKRNVDNLHLQWQNLLYETHHLRKEITKCLSFKSKDEHIELVSVEEFYANAPPSISRPDVTKKDSHALRLARLEWELHQRKVLAETCHELQSKKEKITADIKKKRDRIDNLVPMIKSILAVTKPVQEHLGLPMSLTQSEPELVQLLPPSLYFLSIQADAMREACDPLIKLSIVGDKDSAARFNNNISELTTILDSDSEEENRNYHHRRKSKSQIREEKVKKLLMKHPLSANLQISLKDGTVISVIFHYLINLRIVTVMPSINSTKFEDPCCWQFLNSRNLLNGLYDEDYGERSPNFANTYHLQQLGVEFNTSELGVPYVWAQKLCGLDFTGNIHNPKTNADQRNMSITVQKIREHVKMLMDLYEQLKDIEKLIMPNKYREITSPPVKMACTLSKWELLSFDQFSNNVDVNYLIPILHLTEYDTYFRAIFMRNTAKLTAVIVLRPKYPTIAPIFSLVIENGGKKYSAENSNDVKDMEKEINFHVDELLENLGKHKTWLLTSQLYKLAICFDIFLECTDRDNFSREKLFYFHVRGRTRSLPFKCIKQGNEGVFVQR